MNLARFAFFLLAFPFLHGCQPKIADGGRPQPEAYAPTMAEEMPAPPPMNTEGYDPIRENSFRNALKYPLSTFSTDVDYASYSNTRRFLMQGELPIKDAVRIEEFVNYFQYDYPEPEGKDPFSVHTEIADCPWNAEAQLVHIGLKGKSFSREGLPPANLVFLLDVSGSMDAPNKLPLLKNAFKLLVRQLRDEDRVAIVVYAGASGVALPSTSGNEKEKILAAIQALQPGGSTAGTAGIELAYQIAGEHFLKDGINRVILATDGDFNVGPSSDAALVRLIEQKREAGVFLSVFGFGTGNYQDAKMEKLADNGNGQFAYIDNIQEARKVLVNEMAGTLHTIAKDVKIQVEFNPAHVEEYRLIGYENRLLRDEDFNDDRKDAGDMGAGHTVTALYEVIPAGKEGQAGKVDELKYSENKISESAPQSPEWLTVKLRYKLPSDSTSQLIEEPVVGSQTNFAAASEDFRFAASVAGFGLLLRDSEFKGTCTYPAVAAWARESRGEDPHGFRSSFLQLVELAGDLSAPVTDK